MSLPLQLSVSPELGLIISPEKDITYMGVSDVGEVQDLEAV